jgi:acetylornithine/succinyldiaminopimelate/putrescine aminotransferase
MTLAKALANGFPVGAVAARPDVAEAFDPGSHASTFGGNPLAMAAASATLDVMLEQDIPGQCRQTGAYLTDRLQELRKLHGGIEEIRSRGLMIGIQCDADISSIPRDALKEGIMLNVIQGSVLRLVPPLIITRQECDEAVEKIDKLLKEKGV